MDESFSEAEAALDEARRLAGEPRPDVLAASRKATEAAQHADKLLAGVRQAQVQFQRTQQNAISAIATAKADIGRASDYIGVNRRSQNIGREARNRLADAQRLVTQAEATLATDVNQALQQARTANSLANQAYTLARRDSPAAPPIDYTQYRPDDGIGSLVLGAMLGGMFSGAGRGRGATRSGSASPSRSGGGRFGGGRSSSGSFGRGGLGMGGFGGGIGGRSGGGFGGGRSSSGRW